MRKVRRQRRKREEGEGRGISVVCGLLMGGVGRRDVVWGGGDWEEMVAYGIVVPYSIPLLS